jgi:hypothetical protein
VVGVVDATGGNDPVPPDLPTSPTPSPDGGEDQTVKPHARTRGALAWSLWLVTVGCCAAALRAVIRPLTLAVVADAAFWLVFLLGSATIGLVVTLRRPANPAGGRGRAHDGPQVRVVSYAEL